MKNYNLPLTSLFLVLMNACALNADVANNNISNEPNSSAGTSGAGGSPVVPPVGGAGGSSDGGTSAGGSSSVSVDGGIEAGAGGDIGVGGTVSFTDAGVDSGADPQPEPLPEPRACNTPSAIGSDQGNWFTTNAMVTEFRSHWFQLIDADGFVDSCTYVGRVKWYHPEVDLLNQTWYVSDGLWDDPTTILTINFNDDGSVADRSQQNTVYPGAGYTRGICDRAYVDTEWEGYGSISISSQEYELKYCFSIKTGYHLYPVIGLFRGTWSDSFQKPILPEPVRETPPLG